MKLATSLTAVFLSMNLYKSSSLIWNNLVNSAAEMFEYTVDKKLLFTNT